jgi:hypothetical protein
MAELTCPECSTPMTFVQFASCPTPFHLRCARCKTPLRVETLGWLIVVAAALLGAALIIARQALELSNPVFFGSMIAGILIFEVGAFVLLRAQGIKLVVRNAPDKT